VSWCRSKAISASSVQRGRQGHQDGFENERKGNADALDFWLIAQVANDGFLELARSSYTRTISPR
jgi:hypothetical protein